jgi:hypothetical protein
MSLFVKRGKARATENIYRWGAPRLLHAVREGPARVLELALEDPGARQAHEDLEPALVDVVVPSGQKHYMS